MYVCTSVCNNVCSCVYAVHAYGCRCTYVRTMTCIPLFFLVTSPLQPAISFDLSDMIKLEEIGRGITGQVYRMRHQPTGRVVAAKVRGGEEEEGRSER